MALSTRRMAPRQFTYILRIWETRSIPPDPAAKWSAALEDVDSGKTMGFPDLEALIGFLGDLPTGDQAEETTQEEDGPSE